MNFFQNNIYKELNLILILLLFIIIIFINNHNDKYNDQTNIPELLYYNNQKIQVFTSSAKCRETLYFSPEYREFNDSIKIKKINLKDKNYFITFYETDHVYNQHLKSLEKHGLIRSYYQFGKNNLIISPIKENPLILNKSNIYALDKYQKVYRYLNAPLVFQKDSLYSSYDNIKNIFFEDFNYMPETYIYPEQKNIIYNKFKNYKLNLSNLWLVKPTNKYGGHDINIFDSLKNIKLKEFIITKYIKNVNLIKDKKYDLRLYVLITGLKPLRIYFYKEGLVRIASEKYSLNSSSIENKFMHLTNMCVNTKNKNYIRPNSSNEYNSNLWNILMYKTFLKQNNIEWDDIREKIKDIIIKSIISVYQNLTEENEKYKLSDQNFYEILGFDILINDKFNPILCEINYVPEMFLSNNLDTKIKSNLFIDTLNLIGIIPYSRKKEKSLVNKYKLTNEVNDNVNNALCELARPRGDFELIFPSRNTITRYNKYFINNTEENMKFWEYITSLS